MSHELVKQLWQQKNLTSVDALKNELMEFHMLCAYYSNKIDNDKTTYRTLSDIFEYGKVSKYSGKVYIVQEQQNQRTYLDYVLPKIVEKQPISPALIKETQLLLLQGTYSTVKLINNQEFPGYYRKNDYDFAGQVGEEPCDIEGCMNELIEEVNEATGDPLKIGAYFHGKFLSICPFADGNGRTGRALLNYYLMINDHPPLVIYDNNKGIYAKTLERFDVTGDLDPLYRFLEAQLLKTWEREIKNLGLNQDE